MIRRKIDITLFLLLNIFKKKQKYYSHSSCIFILLLIIFELLLSEASISVSVPSLFLKGAEAQSQLRRPGESELDYYERRYQERVN
jgi:hypothetical protein